MIFETGLLSKAATARYNGTFTSVRLVPRSKSTFIDKLSPLVMFALFRVLLEFEVCERLIVNGRVEVSVMFLSVVLSAWGKGIGTLGSSSGETDW